MATVILGSTKCPICKEIIHNGADIVTFSWFESNCQTLREFSDAGVHFSCLKSHPDLTKVEEIYLKQFGEDGVRPNGSKTVTLSTSLRISFDGKKAVIGYAPLFLTLEMPRTTGALWKTTNFWVLSSENRATFVGKGFDAEYHHVNSTVHFRFRLCPHSFTPNDANPKVIREILRNVSLVETRKVLSELKRALNAIEEA